MYLMTLLIEGREVRGIIDCFIGYRRYLIDIVRSDYFLHKSGLSEIVLTG